MAFKRQLRGDLLAWDNQAGGAALVAQVMIMGGVLHPDFDTKDFDRWLGRMPGRRLDQAIGLRALTTAIPTLTITMVDSMPIRHFTNPDNLRKAWLQRGIPLPEIDRYLGSKHYARARVQAVNFIAAGALIGPQRFKEEIVGEPRMRIQQLLLDGGVAVTADAESRNGLVMLSMSNRSPGKVRIYFPDSGTRLSTLDELHYQGVINLDHFGATVHAM